MKILFVADGRSPTALNWIRYFVDTGMEIHLVSTFPPKIDFDMDSIHVIQIPFSGAGLSQNAKGEARNNPAKSVLQKLATPSLRTWFRHHFVPRGLAQSAATLAAIIEDLKPDVVHAMRIPYEGMMAALAIKNIPGKKPPLLISVWGNDFTLHAPATKEMGALTHQAMRLTNAIHTDCHRDLTLAGVWGFMSEKPAIVLPGGGGIQPEIFYPPHEDPGPVVINPRGYRVYIRNDTFFKAIPMVLSRHSEVKFICPSMEGQGEAEQWVKNLRIEQEVRLLPRQERISMAEHYRKAQIVISPSTHDGTPNTLLEAMACGCFPIAGDIESIREWITPGKNGLLVNPNDPKALAEAICMGLENDKLKEEARAINTKLVLERADYQIVMNKAVEFYRQIIHKNN